MCPDMGAVGFIGLIISTYAFLILSGDIFPSNPLTPYSIPTYFTFFVVQPVWRESPYHFEEVTRLSDVVTQCTR